MSEAVLRVRVDGKAASADVRRLDGDLDRLSKSGDRAEKSTRNVGGAMSFMKRAVAGLALGALAGQVVAVNTQFDKLQGQLQTITGSADLAGRALGAIERFASNTPFALEQSVEAFVKMRALGLEPTERALTAFGNTSAAMGRDLNQMIEAVADAATGEFERLKEFGIKAKSEGDRVKFTFQGVTTEVGKNAEEITNYLTSIGEVNFAGAMEDQMNRLPGLFSNLQDAIRGVVTDLGQAGLNELIGDTVRFAIDWFSQLREWIRTEMPAALAVLEIRMQGWSEVVSTAVDYVATAWTTMRDLILGDEASLGGMFDGLGGLLADLPTLLDAGIQTALATIDGFADKIPAYIDRAALGAKAKWAVFTNFVETSVLEALGFVGGLIDQFVAATVADLAQVRAAMAAVPGFGAFKAAVDGAIGALSSMGSAADGSRAAIERLEGAHEAEMTQLQAGIDAANAAIDTRDEKTRGLIQTINDNRDATVLARIATEDEARERERAAAAASNHSDSIDDVLAAMGSLNGETGEAITLTDDQRKAYEKLRAELYPLEAAAEAYRMTVDLLVAAHRANGTSSEELEADIRRLNAEFEKQRAQLLGVKEDSDKAKDAADPFAEAWVGALERIDSAFADAWKGAFDSFGDFADRLKDAFKQLLAEMAHLAITRPILMQLGLGGAGGFAGAAGGGGQNLMGLFGFGGGGGGYGGAIDLGSLGQAGGGGALAGLSGFGQTLATTLGGQNAGAAVAGSGGGLGFLGALALPVLGGAATAGLGRYGGALGGAAGGLIATGTSIFGGTGAAFVSQLGITSAVGGTALGAEIGSAIIPIIGTIIGAIIGAVVGRMVNNNTNPSSQLSFGSARGPQDLQLTDDFGPVYLGSGRDGFIDYAEDVAEPFRVFFDALSSIVSEEQRAAITAALQNMGDIQITREMLADGTFFEDSGVFDAVLGALDPAIQQFVRGVGGSIEDQMNALGSALAVEQLVAATDMFTDLGEALTFLSEVAGGDVELMANIVGLAEAIQVTRDTVASFAESDVLADYNLLIEQQGRTVSEALSTVDASIRAIAEADEISVEQLQQLPNLLAQRYQLELQFLAQIDAAISGINTSFNQSIANIEASQRTPEEQYEFLRGQANDLAARIFAGEFTDPEALQQAAADVNRLTNEAFRLLDADQQAMVADEYIAFLESVRDESTKQLEDMRDVMLEQANSTRDLLDDMLTRLPEPLIMAADALIDAAEALNPDDPGPGTGAPGGGDPGDPVTKPPLDPPRRPNEPNEPEGGIAKAVKDGSEAGSERIVTALREHQGQLEAVLQGLFEAMARADQFRAEQQARMDSALKVATKRPRAGSGVFRT